MKKILVIFLMLFGMSNVYALEYSDYSDFSEYTDEYIQSDDLTDVRTERRYKYYKLEKELGGYGESDLLNYPYIDKEDYIYSDFSDFSIDMPEEKDGRIIEEILGYRYKKLKDVNYLEINCVVSPIVLSNIEVLYNGEKVDYEIETENLTVEGDNFNLAEGGRVRLWFDSPMDLRFLTLSFSLISGSIGNSGYHVASGYDDLQYTLYLKYYSGEESFFYKGNDAIAYSSNTPFEDYYSATELDTNRIFQDNGRVNLYRYKDILYRSYNLNKVYYDEYLTGPYEDFIYKDEFLYKDYYSKRVRSIISNPINLEEKTDEKVDIENVSSEKKTNTITDMTDSTYQIPEKSLYYPIDINKIDNLKNGETSMLFCVYLPFILILVILILVLSKLYQKNKKRVKV